MVAVFTGNGLGLYNSSLTQLGLGLGDSAGLGQSRTRQYVNVASGNLVLQDQDESLVVRGLNTTLLRTYNSRGSVAGSGADGFVTGYERRVALTAGMLNDIGSQMTLSTGDGQDVVFTWSGTLNQYTSTAGEGAHDTLSYDAADRTWTYVEGSTQREEQYADHADALLQGRLTRIRDLRSDGTTPAQFDVLYDDNQRVTEVRSLDGSGAMADALIFGYDGAGRLASVATREDGVIRGQLSYGYDNEGRLSWVQTDLTPSDGSDDLWDETTAANNNGLRFRTSYTYVTANDLRLASVTQSDGTITSYTYEADGAGGYRVKTVTRGDGNNNDADGIGETVTFTYSGNQTDVADSLGRAWTYQFDANGQLTTVLAPPQGGLRDVTTYAYNAAGDVTQVQTVRGATTLAQLDYAYDGNGNAIQQWDALGNTIKRNYGSANQLLSETVYTDVDADRTGPGQSVAGLTTNYVYDAQNRLRFVVDAAGDVQEIRYATTGAGIGQRSAVRQYLGAGYAGAYDESSLATWAAGQVANSTLTELSYDAKGRLAQQTAYASVDAAGNGVFDAATGITRYSYDAQGLLLQQIEVRGAGRALTGTSGPDGSEVTDYVYDGLGRLLSILKRDASTVTSYDNGTITTTYAYLDSDYELQVTQDSGALRVETRNAAGRLLSVVESDRATAPTITRTTQNIYDSVGQLRATEDASGARRYFFYDAKGRLEASVDETGAVTQTSYDGDDRPVQVRQYATRVNTSAWLVNGAVVPATLADIGVIANNGSDRIRAMTYDAAGRLVVETDGLAASSDRQIATTTYDGAGRVLQVTVTDAAGTSSTARTTRNFYDSVGRLTGTLDAEGYLVEHVYDRAGRRVQTIGYARLTASGNRATGTLAQLRPASDAGNDQITRFYYNGRGQAVGMLDAEGYLSETVIDEAGHVRAERRYAAAVNWIATDTLASLRSRAGGSYRENRLAYDGLGYLITQTNPEGTVTRYSYDEAGRLVRTEVAAQTTDVRENFTRYNVFGEIIGEIGGEQAAQASAALLGGKALNDPSLTEAQLDAAYSQYGVRHSVDALGRRIESIDAQGNKTWLFYDGQGRQTFQVRGVASAIGVANALGEVSETRYNAFGQVTDVLTYTNRITIPIAGDRVSVDSVIRTLSFVASLDSRRQMTYTARGQLATIVDAEGALSRFTYNAFGERSREELAVGTSVALTVDRSYDKRGLQVTQTDSGSTISRSQNQAYDVFGRVISRTDARGTVTTFRYDRLGRQLEQSVIAAGRQETSTLAYDAFDRVLTQTDPLGQSTTYQYNDSQRRLIVTTPEGVTVLTVHNRHGQAVTVTQNLADGSNAVTRYAYDQNGALLSTSDPLNQTSNNEYDVRGLLIATVDATGYRVELHYDAAGRVLSRVVDPTGLNLVTQYRYDGQGRQVQVTDATGVVSTQRYDREGRLLETVQDVGAGRLNLSTLYSYDAQGRQISVTEGAGTAVARTARSVFDALGRRISETVDAGAGRLNLTTTYAYDDNDNLIRRTDAAGQVTQYAYDKANRLAYVIDPTGAAIRTWVDAAGRTVMTRAYAQRLDPAAVVDKTVGQIDALLVSNDAADLVSYRVYDRDGRLRYTMDALGDVRESIVDAAGRTVGSRTYATVISIDAGLRSKLMAGTATVSDIAAKLVIDDNRDVRSAQVFDAAGRLRFSIDALGQVQEQRYDAAGRITQTLDYANALSAAVLTPATLDALRAGAVSVATVASWVASQQASARSSTQVFDGAGRVRYTLTRDSASTVLVREHRYDALGQPTAEVVYGVAISSATPASEAAVAAALTAAGGDSAANQRLTQYVYDADGRLRYTIDNLNLVTEQRYDALGQVSETRSYTAAISAGTALTLAGLTAATAALANRSTKYAYDAAGRRTQVTDALNHTETTTYDALGQRTSLTNRLGYTWNYSYDAAGRLVTETTPTVAVARYDAIGHLFLSFERVVTRLGYDAFGNVISRTEGDGTPEARTTQYAYDLRGNQTRTIFPRAGVYNEATSTLDTSVGISPETQITYDALDRAVVQKDTNGNFSYKVYDRQGQLAYDIDAEGFVTGYTYNAYGEQTGLTRYANRLNTGAPAFAGWQTGQAIGLAPLQAALVTSAADRTVTTTYDALGLSLSVTQAAVSYVTAFGTPSTGSPRTEFTYDRFGQLVKTAVLIEGTPGQANAVWANTYNYYDGLGRQIRRVDAEGYVTAWEYDAQGQVTQQIEYARAIATGGLTVGSLPATPASGDASIGYDRINRFTYDALGRRTSETVVRHYQREDGSQATSNVVTTIGYDNEGHATTVTTGIISGISPNGTTTATEYDALGRTVSVTEAERSVLRNDAEAQLLQSPTLGLGSAALYEKVSPYTTMVYDTFGNLLQSHQYANGWHTGAPAAVIDEARDQFHTSRYDLQGRLVWDRDAEGKEVIRTYDGSDNVITESYWLTGTDGRRAQIVSNYQYDKLGRQTLNRVDRLQYDSANGQPHMERDALENVAYNAFGEISGKGYDGSSLPILYSYDAAGRLIRSNADGGTVRDYAYNLAGYQVRESHQVVTDAGSIVAQSVQNVDRLGRVTRSTLPSHEYNPFVSSVLRQQLDRWGNVLQMTDTRGYVTDYQYNDLNQVVRETRPLVKVVSETGIESWQRPVNNWNYDALGRLVSTRDANGNMHKFRYDNVGQQTATIDALGKITSQSYDVLGNNIFSQDALGYLTFRQFDRMARVTAQGDYFNSASSARMKNFLQRFSLNGNGDRLTVTDASDHVQKYDYDSRNLLLRSLSAMGVMLNYSYDGQGNKIFEANGIDTQTWLYDAFERLQDHADLSGTDYNYSYDASSGLQVGESNGYGLSRSISYYANGRIRQITEGGNTYLYEYDAAGNRTLEDNLIVDGGGKLLHVTTRSSYDSNNRLERVTQDNEEAGVTKRVFDLTYTYDAVGNRRSVTSQSAYGPGIQGIGEQPNLAPLIINPPKDQTLRAGIAVPFRLNPGEIFRDPEGQLLTITVGALPSWLTVSMDETTGELVFEASTASTVADNGFAVSLTASDGVNNTSTAFKLLVVPNTPPIRKPELPNPIKINVKTGVEWTKALIASDYFIDPDVGDTLKLSLLTDLPDWLPKDDIYSANPSVLNLHGTPQSADEGTFTFTLQVKDDAGFPAEQVFEITVSDNHAPVVLINPILQNTVIGRNFTWSAPLSSVFADPDGDPLVVTADLLNNIGLPGWMDFAVISGEGGIPMLQLSASPVPANEVDGTQYTVVLSASDEHSSPVTSNLIITLHANQAPVVVIANGVWPVPDALVHTAYRAEIPLSSLFADPENDRLTLSTIPSGLPIAGWLDMSIVGDKVVLSGTPALNTQAGDLSFQLRATDSDGLPSIGTVSVTMHIKGDNPPIRNPNVPLPDYDIGIGHVFNIQLPDDLFTDADGDALTVYINAITFGPPDFETPAHIRDIYSADPPTWLTYDAKTRSLSGMVPSNTPVSTLNFLIFASDGKNTSSIVDWTDIDDHNGEYLFKLNIKTLANNAPLRNTATLDSQSANEGEMVNIPLPSGTFTEPDGQLMTYRGEILIGGSWYSLLSHPLGLSIDASNGTISGAITNPTQSSYTVRIYARDTDPAPLDSLPVSFTLNVDRGLVSPGTLNTPAIEGEPFTYAVSGFSDPEGGSLSYAFDTLDGSSWPTWLSRYSTGVISGTPPAGFAGLSILVTATDSAVPPSSATATLNINMVNPPPQYVAGSIPNSFSPLGGLDWSYTFPATAFTNLPRSEALTYSATWNGSSTQPPGLSFNAATRTFSGKPPVGVTFTVVVKAADSTPQPATATFTLTGVNAPPVYNGGLVDRVGNPGQAMTWTLPAGTFTDANNQALAYSAQVEVPAHERLVYRPQDGSWESVPVAATWADIGVVGLSINSVTGTITGTPGTLLVDGLSFTNYRIQIVASDGFAEAPGEFNFIRNLAPTAISTTVYAQANQFFSQQLAGSDPENQTLTYSYTGTLPAGVSLSNTGMLSGTATTAGNYSVSVTVTDASGASSAPATITLNVSPEYPRVINPIPDQSVVQSTAWSYVVPGNTFNNPSGGGITYAAMEVFTVPGHFNAEGYWEDAYDNTRTLPSWITFNPNTRQFSGTAPSTLSSLRVQVAATFTAPASTITDEFVLSVVPPTNNPPVVAKVIPNQTAKQGVNWNFAIPAGTFTDPNGDVLTYSASGYPSGVGFNGTSFTGKPSVSGTFTITVTASDGRPGGVASTSFTVTVVPNDPPVVAKVIPNQTAKQGLNWSFAIPAGTFTDPNGDALTYTAWDYPSGANFNGSSFTGAPSVSGSFTVMVMAMDGRGGTVTTSFTLTVAANNPPVVAKTIPNQSATKGTSWDFPLPAGTFSDPNGDALIYSATGYPSGISFNGSGFTGAPSVTGTFTITVTANDGRPGGVVSTSFTLTVVAPPTPNNNPIVVTPISNKSATKGTTWDFTIPAGTFTDPDGDALTYSASGYPSGVSFTPATRAFSGAPSVTGTFTITVTANDGNGGTTPTTFTLTVNAPANVAPVLVNPIPDQYIDGGTYLSFSVDGTFYDPDSALIYSATGMPAWLTFNATTRVFSGTSGTKFDLTQTITVKATESPAGASATTTFVLSVTNGGSSLLASDPNTTTASSSPTPAKQKFALGNPSTTHANAEAIEHANTQAGLGAGSAGTGGVSALLAEPGEPGSPPEPPPLTPPQIQTTWYTYDAENRVQVVQGKLENGQIVLGDDIHSSYEQRYDAVGNAVVKIYRTQTDGTIQAQASQYDLRGNKTTDLAFVNLSAPPPVTATPVMVRYHYSATNQLEMRSEYYAPDTKIQVRLTDREGISFLAEADISGMLASAVEYSYDADGRLTGESNWERPTTVDNGDLVWVKRVANHQQGIKDDQVWVDDQRSDENLDEKLNSTSATNHFYDIAGRAFKYEDATALLFTYTTTFEGRDSYLESTVSGTSSDSRFKPTTNTLTYDAAGRLLSQREHTTLSSGTLPDRMRYYSNNADGMVQSRRDGRIENGVFVQGDPALPDDPKPNFQFVNAGGQQVAQLREGGEVTLAATKQQAASTRTEDTMLSVAGTSPYAAGGGKVLVQEGDTLSTLAQRVYGNRSLWYVLAQANGLSDPDGPLTAGTALNAPSVSVNKNDASTFRPYNPAEAIGPTSPELPFIDPPKQGCNVLATLIVVAITVAVAAAVGPEATQFFQSTFAAATAAGTATATTTTLGLMAGEFVGGVAGSLVGQAAGMALGVTDHLSLRSAVGSGLTAALTAGIADKLGGTTSQLMKDIKNVGPGKVAASALLNAGASAVGSRISGTAFSWKAVAANAVSNMVTAGISRVAGLDTQAITGGSGNFGDDFANGLISGVVNVHTRRQFGFNDRIDYGNIAADAFGNALGNAVGRDIVHAIDVRQLDSNARKKYDELLRDGTDKRFALELADLYGGLINKSLTIENVADAPADGAAPKASEIPDWLKKAGIDLQGTKPLDSALLKQLLRDLDGVPKIMLDAAELLSKTGGRIEFGQVQTRTVRDENGAVIQLAYNTLTSPEVALLTIAHEIGHALDTRSAPTYGQFMNEADYKKAFADFRYSQEAQATIFALDVRQEYKTIFQQAHGEDANFNFFVNGKGTDYQAIYDQYIGNNIDRSVVLSMIASIYPSESINNEGVMTYAKDISEKADKAWKIIQNNLENYNKVIANIKEMRAYRNVAMKEVETGVVSRPLSFFTKYDMKIQVKIDEQRKLEQGLGLPRRE